MIKAFRIPQPDIYRRIKNFQLSVLLLVLTISGCKTENENIPFTVIAESLAFPTTGNPVDAYPELVLLSKYTEIDQLDFAGSMPISLDHIDFTKSLVILVQRGQLADSGTVEEITSGRNVVTVKTREIDPGPGSYVVSGFSPPYQVLEVEKTDSWNGYIAFVLERKNVGVVNRTTVYIP